MYSDALASGRPSEMTVRSAVAIGQTLDLALDGGDEPEAVDPQTAPGKVAAAQRTQQFDRGAPPVGMGDARAVEPVGGDAGGEEAARGADRDGDQRAQP